MKDNSLGALMVFLIAIVTLILIDDMTQSNLNESEIKLTSKVQIESAQTDRDIAITDEIE